MCQDKNIWVMIGRLNYCWIVWLHYNLMKILLKQYRDYPSNTPDHLPVGQRRMKSHLATEGKSTCPGQSDVTTFFKPRYLHTRFLFRQVHYLLRILICVISTSRKYLISSIFVSSRTFYWTFPVQEELNLLEAEQCQFTHQALCHLSTSNIIDKSWQIILI